GQASCASASDTPPLTSVSTDAKSVAAWAKAALERPRTTREDRIIFFMGVRLHVGEKSGDRLAGPRRTALLLPVSRQCWRSMALAGRLLGRPGSLSGLFPGRRKPPVSGAVQEEKREPHPAGGQIIYRIRSRLRQGGCRFPAKKR